MALLAVEKRVPPILPARFYAPASFSFNSLGLRTTYACCLWLELLRRARREANREISASVDAYAGFLDQKLQLVSEATHLIKLATARNLVVLLQVKELKASEQLLSDDIECLKKRGHECH